MGNDRLRDRRRSHSNNRDADSGSESEFIHVRNGPKKAKSAFEAILSNNDDVHRDGKNNGKNENRWVNKLKMYLRSPRDNDKSKASKSKRGMQKRSASENGP